ncbi:ATP-binding cassette domain-containing protein [Yoonia sp. BS5-3]|uniref:ATP-binding cassette domain-containing protein n=1 Tax=Yoonia phaeophyticola TaxID=3137369 RepID=A0ABZ2V3X7_9RHOB
MVDAILPLKMQDAVVKRRGKTLLGPASLTVAQTGLTIILGPNGSGKTTLLRALHGLDRLSEGQINWQTSVQKAQLAQAFVFQAPIMMRRSVRENLSYPLQLRGVAQDQITAAVGNWAARIGLTAALDQPAPQLSGGEKQKLALGRALISDPQILFLDEPCANLDGRATREIEAILHQVQTKGTRILMATHDIGQARRLATDVVFLMHGKIIETGDADSFFAQPTTAEAAALLNGDIVE